MREVDGFEGRLYVSNSPHVSELVMGIRHADLQRSNHFVRGNVKRIGDIMAYEVENIETAKGTFNIKQVEVTTGNGGAVATHRVRSEEPIILNILRSANDMVDGVREVFREAPVVFADTKRLSGTYNKGNITTETKYMAVPNPARDGSPFTTAGRVPVVPDPMGATFYSAERTADTLLSQYGDATRIIFMTVMAAEPGVRDFFGRMEKTGLNVAVYTAVLDPTLDDKAYIVPGAGDLGDLQHNGGIPLHQVLRDLYER